MKQKIKILVMGLSGSGKTTLSKELSKILDAELVNADDIRKRENDWDFSIEGRLRQSKRMINACDIALKNNKNVIADFICPTKEIRKKFAADFTIWMDTIKKCKYEDTNQLFEPPKNDEVNYIVKEKDKDYHEKLIAEKIYKIFK